MTRFLKVNSQALWSFIAAAINLGILFDLFTLDPEQIAAINTFYLGGMMILRQMFSLTDPPPPDLSIPL